MSVVVVDDGGGGCGGVHHPVLCTPATITYSLSTTINYSSIKHHSCSSISIVDHSQPTLRIINYPIIFGQFFAWRTNYFLAIVRHCFSPLQTIVSCDYDSTVFFSKPSLAIINNSWIFSRGPTSRSWRRKPKMECPAHLQETTIPKGWLESMIYKRQITFYWPSSQMLASNVGCLVIWGTSTRVTESATTHGFYGDGRPQHVCPCQWGPCWQHGRIMSYPPKMTLFHSVRCMKFVMPSKVKQILRRTASVVCWAEEVPHIQLKTIDLPADKSLADLLPVEARLNGIWWMLQEMSWKPVFIKHERKPKWFDNALQVDKSLLSWKSISSQLKQAERCGKTNPQWCAYKQQ